MDNRLFTDTTDFISIDHGDIIQIGRKQYAVTGNERERRFGIDDPKYWVKRAVDMETGQKKFIKLSFFESFETNLAGIKIRCFRNPQKEGDVLELVRDHPYFMHGKAYEDIKKNNIRILEPVNGPNLYTYIGSLNMQHEVYFKTVFPGILRNLIKAFEAVRLLHINGFRHGDIRSDHLIIENETGNYVWIDFDFDYDSPENPFSLDLFEMGNLLLYAVGKGFHTVSVIREQTEIYGDLIDNVENDDFSILHKWRLVNLRKLYPYIPYTINDVLRHFSRGAEIYYETAEEIIIELNKCLYTCF